MSDPATRKSLLFEALADLLPEARSCGATLLRDYREPDVCDRLHRLALVDPDASVRSEAISSLSAIPNDDLMSSLLREAENDDHPYQAEAVDALRIFRDEALPARLQTLVNRPVALSVREAAIKTLACLDIPQAVDALLGIALKDPDPEDELAATMALAQVTDRSLNQRILDQLRLPGISWAGWAVRIAVALVALVIALPLNLLILDLEAGSVAFWALVLTLPTGWLVRRLSSRQLSPLSPAGMVGLGLFALSAATALFWFHGLGHLFTGRWRRGMLLFVAEAVGIVSAIAGVLAFPLNPWLGGFYLFTGAALFIGSYLVDVSGAFFDSALASRRETGRRTVAIYRHIVANQVITAILFESLSADDRRRSRRAQIVLRTYGHLIPPDHLFELIFSTKGPTSALAVRSLARSKTERTVEALEQRWNLDPSDNVRSQVARVLYLRPTRPSLKSLHRLRKEMSAILKAKASWAAWRFRLSDWPWYSKTAVVLIVPAMIVLGYHGVMVLKNRAWSTILILKEPSWAFNAVTEEQKIKTVHYLADVHPADSRDALLKEFMARHDNITDPLGTAIANGLLTIYTSLWDADSAEQDALRGELLGSVDAFAHALASGDSASAERSLLFLASMGAADDSSLAEAGVGTLTAFVRTRPDAHREATTLDALASLPYDRALPALDGLAADTTDPRLLIAIRERMNRAVDSASQQAKKGGGTNREHLLAVLREVKLPQPPPAVGRTIRELELRIPRGCDLNHDEACDDQDTALEDVSREPAAEHGYRDLFDRYVISQRYPEAKAEFERLKDLHPTSIWPRKVLAELYHEYLAPTDSTAFQSSYDEMVGLREMGAYRELRADSNTYNRIEADFAEVALTAGRYDVMRIVSPQLVRPGSRDVYKLNMALFDYIGEVAQRNTSGAEASLQRLRIVVDSLPEDFYNGWFYPGTMAFIKLMKLPGSLEQEILALCREGNWYNHGEALRILDANQAALKHLK